MNQSLKIIGGLALILVLVLLLIKQCQNAGNNDSKLQSFHSETHDTTFLPGDTVYRDKVVMKPYPVYLSAATDEQKLLSACDTVRAYADSLRIDSTCIVYYSDTILGKKLTSRLTYSGKPYTKIIKESIHDSVIRIENRKIYTNGFYAVAGAGGNITQFDYNLGAEYVSQKNWSVGYSYGLLLKTHSVRVGYRLVNF